MIFDLISHTSVFRLLNSAVLYNFVFQSLTACLATCCNFRRCAPLPAAISAAGLTIQNVGGSSNLYWVVGKKIAAYAGVIVNVPTRIMKKISRYFIVFKDTF